MGKIENIPKIISTQPYMVDKRVTTFSPLRPVSQDEIVGTVVIMQSGYRISPDFYPASYPSGT